MTIQDLGKKQEALRKLIPLLEDLIARDDLHQGVVFLETRDGTIITVSLYGEDANLISLKLLGMIDIWKLKTMIGIKGTVLK